MVLRKGNSCMSVMMLTIFGTTYTHSSAFSGTPSMLLEHVITFVCTRLRFNSRLRFNTRLRFNRAIARSAERRADTRPARYAIKKRKHGQT